MSQPTDSTPSSRPVAGAPITQRLRDWRAGIIAPDHAEWTAAHIDALDALRKARNGCGDAASEWPHEQCGYLWVFWDPPRRVLCSACRRKLDAALSALLGGDDA